MTRGKKYVVLVLALLLMAGAAVLGIILGAHHEEKDKEHHRSLVRAGYENHDKKRDRKHHQPPAPATTGNESYKSNCGACHLAYPPELLPAASWDKILTRLGDHFGEALSLDDRTQQEIRKYLVGNAADRSGRKTAGKILRHLGGSTPARVTEISYIQRKHREIGPQVFKRQSVGSFSNCLACHKGAEQGDFDDDRAAIPQ